MRERSLAEFRGKLVLLNLWATGCPPSQEEMPALDRLNARRGGPHFEVVALAIGRSSPEMVRDLYRRLSVRSLRIFVDTTGRAASELRLNPVPTALLVDGEGREIGRIHGSRAWDGDDAVALVDAYLTSPGGSVKG